MKQTRKQPTRAARGKKPKPVYEYLVGYNTKSRHQVVYGKPQEQGVQWANRMTLTQAKRYAAKEMRSDSVPVSIFRLVPVVTGYVRSGVFTPLSPARKGKEK